MQVYEAVQIFTFNTKADKTQPKTTTATRSKKATSTVQYSSIYNSIILIVAFTIITIRVTADNTQTGGTTRAIRVV